MSERNMKDMVAGVHLSHCNQGEYVGSCKFGADDCPALEQEDKCPECKGDGFIFGFVSSFGPEERGDCPTCNGTGEKKLDSADREDVETRIQLARLDADQKGYQAGLKRGREEAMRQVLEDLGLVAEHYKANIDGFVVPWEKWEALKEGK